MTKMCDDCEIGYYKDSDVYNEKCKSCGEGNTTETTGSTSINDCIGMLNLVGYL